MRKKAIAAVMALLLIVVALFSWVVFNDLKQVAEGFSP